MPTAVGFKYGTTSGSLNQTVSATDNSGTLSATLTGLSAGTTYYYKAFVTVYGTGDYSSQSETFYGSEYSFTTNAAPQPSLPGYLGCYEVPAVADMLNGNSTSGTNTNRGDVWYRYYTTSATRQIATHSFTHPDTNQRIRNYTILYDQTNYAPLWCAHAMHASMWPKNDIDRSSWTTDPAISLTQQSGLDSPYSNSISRGHFVAAQYRKCNDDSMDQTFYYTNQAPQNQSFNGGLWAQLETQIVNAAPSNTDTLYVVTGVLYDDDWYAEDPANRPTHYPSGNLSVPYPSHFYVCLMKCSFSSPGVMSNAVGCAYICTNEPKASNKVSDLPNYKCTINHIEDLTGFDFFANVPSGLQSTAETQTASLW